MIISGFVLAQSSISLNINTQHPGAVIPDDFNGISLEMGALKSGNGGTPGNMFDDTTVFPTYQHKQVLAIFNELGIKNVRVGGGSVDQGIAPSNSDIDAFFRFVKIAGIKVIYSVRLLNGNISTDTNVVKYIWNNYKQFIDCFSIGNEPDFHSYHNSDPAIYEETSGIVGSAFPSYNTDWNKFASAIITAVPEAMFGGPDTGSNWPVASATGTYANTSYNGKTWTVNFADSNKQSGIIKAIYFHNYCGQGASGTPQQMIDKMLSTTWVSSYYPSLYNVNAPYITADGLPYRLTESNSFSGYLKGGSNSFATALWELDYMHWWAEHGAAGLNIHNKQWVGNGPIYLDSYMNYQVYPVGYGMAAFNIGGHGRIDTTVLNNPGALNLTAYAVADTNALYVTIVNKEHGAGMRDARVNISAPGYSDSAAVMYLEVPDSNAADTTGVLLGGESITINGWNGAWSSIDSSGTGSYVVTVPASSAAIVKIMGSMTSIRGGQNIPQGFRLSQNYPNPFNPSTTITYSIPKSSYVSLQVYNILGQAAATIYKGYQAAGTYKFSFDASGLASGVYFYRLEANGLVQTKKMILMK